MAYGMPYMGSKSTIAEKIIGFLPESDYFVDLFGGGGAISHCAALSGKYDNIIYNELDPLVYKGFNMAINGEFANENRWISREEFFKLKDSDPYAALCFSFGNDRRTYCYGKPIEQYKKAAHDYIFRNNKDLEQYYDLQSSDFWNIEDVQERRKKIFSAIKKQNAIRKHIESENIESLQRLQNLQCLQRLQTFNTSYELVKVPDNSIIYCDIPYENTEKYCIKFDKEKFVEFCRSSKQPVYISEYTMPSDFKCVATFARTSIMSPNSREKKCEKLFVHESQYENAQHGLFDF